MLESPNLPAGRVTSDTFNTARIPDLPASKIGSGTFNSDRIPGLPADRINSGTFGTGRIPDLSADKINSGTFGTGRIPALSADKITSDTFNADRIPSLPTSKITSGTFNTDRLGTGASSGETVKFLREDGTFAPPFDSSFQDTSESYNLNGLSSLRNLTAVIVGAGKPKIRVSYTRVAGVAFHSALYAYNTRTDTRVTLITTGSDDVDHTTDDLESGIWIVFVISTSAISNLRVRAVE